MGKIPKNLKILEEMVAQENKICEQLLALGPSLVYEKLDLISLMFIYFFAICLKNSWDCLMLFLWYQSVMSPLNIVHITDSYITSHNKP